MHRSCPLRVYTSKSPLPGVRASSICSQFTVKGFSEIAPAPLTSPRSAMPLVPPDSPCGDEL